MPGGDSGDYCAFNPEHMNSRGQTPGTANAKLCVNNGEGLTPDFQLHHLFQV